MPKRPLVFDIETIPDLTTETRAEVAALAAGREMDVDKYAALCPPLARVVCVGWYDVAAGRLGACADATLVPDSLPASFAVDGGVRGEASSLEGELQACAGEAALLGSFGALVEKHLGAPNGCLVTFGGRNFDLPVLVHRSQRHGVSTGLGLLRRALGESRYRPMAHVDVLDAVTFYGASGRWPLAAYAIGYGWRSPKGDMDGSQVGRAVSDGRLFDVVRYCAGDVLATAHVYAKAVADA